MKHIVSDCGSDGDDEDLTTFSVETAEVVGEMLAEKNVVIVCGGRGGIMEAVCRGAKKAHGVTVGLMPHTKNEANEFVDIALPTGLGSKRNFLVVSCGDVVIAIAGRVGTLNEITYAVILQKPLILIKGTRGCVDELIAANFFSHFKNDYFVVDSAQAAVGKACEILDSLEDS